MMASGGCAMFKINALLHIIVVNCRKMLLSFPWVHACEVVVAVLADFAILADFAEGFRMRQQLDVIKFSK